MAKQTLETRAEHKVSVVDEHHQRAERVQRAQWLRAAILGANDGLLSTASLMLGVGAAKEDRRSMILSGLSGAVAGACSMAVGEFVSVSTQRDIEKMGLDTHAHLHSTANIESGLSETSSPMTPCGRNIQGVKPICELSNIGSRAVTSGRLPVLSPGRSPMMRMISEDAKTKARDLPGDRGEETLPNPLKAAAASALAFLCGSLVPLVSAFLITEDKFRTSVLAVATSIALVLFGGIGAHLGGSPVGVSATRVLVGGWAAMAITYALLKPFDSDDRGR